MYKRNIILDSDKGTFLDNYGRKSRRSIFDYSNFDDKSDSKLVLYGYPILIFVLLYMINN